jgi:hypothetical protein
VQVVVDRGGHADDRDATPEQCVRARLGAITTDDDERFEPLSIQGIEGLLLPRGGHELRRASRPQQRARALNDAADVAST